MSELKLYIATGDAGLQRFRTGGLNRGHAVIQHRAQYLDELSVPVGVLLQLGADLGQRGRQCPILERGAVAQGAGLLHQDRQIMLVISAITGREFAQRLRRRSLVAMTSSRHNEN